MSEFETKPKLEVGKEYLIELYPSNKRVKGKYLGYSEREYKGEKHIDNHVFVFDNGEKQYVLMSNHWMIENKGVLTYISVSSAGVNRATEKCLKEDLPNRGTTEEVRKANKRVASGLLKILRDLGEDI